jgi:nicotinamidase-related amidase
VTPDPYTTPDSTTAALVTIDTQCDVLDGGPLEIAGTSPALPAIAALCAAFRELHRPIVHIVRLYRPDGSNADLCRRSMIERGGELLAPGSPGSELADALLPAATVTLDSAALLAGEIQQLAPAEVAIYKPRWGAFYRTPLERHLREQGVSTLVFCGCNFPNCPRTSIYEGSERDFRVVLVRDAVSGLYERGERELENIGVEVSSSAEVIRAVRSALQLRTVSPRRG